MVSPDKLRNRAAEYAKVTNNKSSRKKRKPSSILKTKKFFFCFKNLSLQTKYETQIKSLGAIVVPYIDKEVHYVVTDIPGYNGSTTNLTEVSNIVSPQCYSVSPATSVSGDDPSAAKKTRTRTEAMLERVSIQAQNVSSISNPINSAISWNIPIYSVDYFQNILNKKLSQVQLVDECVETRNDKSVRVFQKRYLKLEHIVGYKYRPDFREVSRWPSIGTNSSAGTCPFDKKSSRKVAQKDKNHENRKNSERMNRTCNKTANEAGYCEICAVQYSDLSQHVTTSGHLKFICNDKNYTELDNCIKTRSVEAFLASHNSHDNGSHMKDLNVNDEMGRNLRKSVSLHLNNNNENSSVTRSLSNVKLLADESLKQPLQVQCNGFANYHLRKSTIKSDSVLMKSPNVYNNKDLLRETRKMYASYPEGNKTPIKDLSQLSPIEEDGLHRLRSRKSLLLPAILIGTTAEDSSKLRNQLSPQTQTSNHFLRSSSSPKTLSANQQSVRVKVPTEADDCKKMNSANSTTLNKNSNALGLHFTRSKMNCSSVCENDKRKPHASTSPRDETRVNGKSCKRKSSIATSDDEEKCSRGPSSPRNIPSYQCNKNHLFDDSTEHSNVGRKRLSAEEKFLEDNKEYYKVEMLRTKLRSTEFYCNREVGQSNQRRDESKSEQRKLNESEDPMMMRFRKSSQKRQSALHLLNLEATNFMFGPPKRDDSNDESDEEESTETKVADESATKEAAKTNEKNNQQSSCNNVNKCSRAKEKKRRTHAEVFIHDNLDYYKFEISGSRLRHHSDESSPSVKSEPNNLTCLPTATSNIPSDSIQAKVKEEVLTDEEAEMPGARKRRRGKKATVPAPAEELVKTDCEPTAKEESNAESADECCDRPAPPSDSVHFSFESVPRHEAWYKTFQRFDLCEEQHILIPNTVHFSRYRDVTPVTHPRRRVPEKHAVTSSPSSKDNSLLAHFRRKRKQRFSRIIIDDKPRKSPRCHASTLAILSSLTGNRRRSRKLLASLEYANKPAANARTSVNKTDLENKSLLAEVSQQYQKKLKEAVNMVAKDMDDHFIEVFSREDCEDAYLKKMKPETERLANGETEDWHCCMHIDEEIIQDEELLQSLMSDRPTFIDEIDMPTFFESSQRCSSMEAAEDEELSVPRSHDMLAKLCREDFSCNSSDCGASSICEFLGFAEDGRTVSRKRKRKRPNMTGWPHDRNKRRQLRMLRVRQSGVEDANATNVEVAKPDALSVTASETMSEADSECTDDDIPLNEFVCRSKRRRTNNSMSTNDDIPLAEIKNEKNELVNGEGEATSTRRTPKAVVVQSNPRRATPITRRKSSVSQSGRRGRCV